MGFFDISDLFPDQKHLRTLKIALLVAAVYPFYLLTCYMAAKGFYAYEMFSSLAGLVVPVLFMALVFIPALLVFMLLCWGGSWSCWTNCSPMAASGPESTESLAPRQSAKPLIEGLPMIGRQRLRARSLLLCAPLDQAEVRPDLSWPSSSDPWRWASCW